MSVPKYFTTKIEGDNLAEKKTQLEPVQGIYDTYVQTKADCDYLNAVYAQTDNYNRDLYDLIGQLEQKLPKDVEVTSLNVTTTGVSLAFSVANKEEAAASIINLRAMDCFSDVLVTAVTEVTDEEAGTSHVELTADCTYGTNPALLVDETAEENADTAETESAAE